MNYNNRGVCTKLHLSSASEVKPPSALYVFSETLHTPCTGIVPPARVPACVTRLGGLVRLVAGWLDLHWQGVWLTRPGLLTGLLSVFNK